MVLQTKPALRFESQVNESSFQPTAEGKGSERGCLKIQMTSTDQGGFHEGASAGHMTANKS